MNPTHQGTPTWKDEVSETFGQLATQIDNAGLKIGGAAARRFHAKGWHKLANWLDPSKPPEGPTSTS